MKNEFKSLPIILILILLISTMLVACNRSKTAEAEKAVESTLLAIKNANANELKKYVDDEGFELIGINDSNYSGDISRLYLSEIEYNILSSREDDTDILVTVEITALDMNSVIMDFYKEIINSGANSDDEYSRLFKQIIENGNYEKVTNKVDVIAYESSGYWRIKIDESLIKALAGTKE